MVLHDYITNSGRNVILEYIDSLTQKEIVDAYSVRELMEENRFEELHWKPWEKKIYEVYFYKYNRIFYVIPDGENIYIYFMHVESKRTKQKREMQKLFGNVPKK